jgi:hypothetical protein
MISITANMMCLTASLVNGASFQDMEDFMPIARILRVIVFSSWVLQLWIEALPLLFKCYACLSSSHAEVRAPPHGIVMLPCVRLCFYVLI